MRTVGQVLKEGRERQYYSLDEVEKATKIRKELLEALEKGEYQKLPPSTFVQGFIKNYGKFLRLDLEKLLAIYRREFAEYKNPPRVLDAWSNPLDKKQFRLTPAKVLSTVIAGLLIAFFVYLWLEYRFLVGEPFLEVTQPQDQVSVEEDITKVSGKTDPESKVTINNQEVQVDLAGNFSIDYRLTESVNKITITTTSKLGKSSRSERTVFYKGL